jgi:outer membrane protein TolC
LLRCKVCKGFLLKCSLGEFRNRIGNVLRRRRRIRVRGKESAEAALRTASKAAYDSLWASFDLGIIPIQDVLGARTSLEQAMALRATADEAVAASLATLTYISGRF